MIDTGRLIAYIRRKVLAYGMALLLLLILSALAVVLSRLPNLRWPPDSWLLDMGLPILLGMIPGAVALLVARRIAGRFVYALYELGSISEGESCVNTQMFGSAGGPYLVAKEGQIATGSNAIKNIGGPGAVVLYNDSAIVLEQAGRLTRVKRGSGVVRLEPFERVWNTLSILPQRWSFDVT
ncbi:MAG: hypothetical protein KKB13_14625, partial [Chloroflexi bacterium]|nr:hypothetical protein [Chloroflexota bacterium]